MTKKQQIIVVNNVLPVERKGNSTACTNHQKSPSRLAPTRIYLLYNYLPALCSNSLCHRKANHSATLAGDWGSHDPLGTTSQPLLQQHGPHMFNLWCQKPLRHPNYVERMATSFIISADIVLWDGRYLLNQF